MYLLQENVFNGGGGGVPRKKDTWNYFPISILICLFYGKTTEWNVEVDGCRTKKTRYPGGCFLIRKTI